MASRGQRIEDAADLYFYNSRWYDPVVGRFLGPDSVVPAAGNPQSLNRHAYVLNNPLRYTDPSGHCIPGVNCPGMPSGVEQPCNPSSDQTNSEYAQLLTDYLHWLDQQRAETGGMFDLSLIQYRVNEELSLIVPYDTDSLGTFGIGLNASVGGAGFGGTGSVLLMIDLQDNLALIVSGGGGGMTTMPTGSLTVVVQITTAPSVFDLQGWSAQSGGLIMVGPDVGLAVGLDGIVMGGPEGPIYGLQLNVGWGLAAPLPFEFHGGAEYSWVFGTNAFSWSEQ